MAIGNLNIAGGAQIPPVGFVWLSVENTSPAIYFENTTWELISQNRVLMGAGDGHNGGDTVEAGLPNIKGTFIAALRDGFGNQSKPHITGAFYENGTTTGDDSYNSISTNVGIPTGQAPFGFDASRSNSIYGNSDTVQPPAFYVYMWRRAS